MSPHREIPSQSQHGFPRVSGDEPEDVIPRNVAKGFSPRERG